MQGTATFATVVLLVAWAGVSTAFPPNLTEAEIERFTARESAPHLVISDEGAYEVREYEAAAWACAERHVIMKSMEDMMMMFTALTGYLMGGNSLGAELKMTSPITTYKERSPEGGLNMQMCFYIPSDHQANPPQPTVEGVVIHKRDKMKVAARSFVAVKNSMEEWQAAKLALQKALTDSGVKNINFDNYYGAVYNPPGTKDHVQEIWYRMKE